MVNYKKTPLWLQSPCMWNWSKDFNDFWQVRRVDPSAGRRLTAYARQEAINDGVLQCHCLRQIWWESFTPIEGMKRACMNFSALMSAKMHFLWIEVRKGKSGTPLRIRAVGARSVADVGDNEEAEPSRVLFVYQQKSRGWPLNWKAIYGAYSTMSRKIFWDICSFCRMDDHKRLWWSDRPRSDRPSN